MLGKYLKRKLGREEEIPPTEQFYSPLRIGLHTTLNVSTVDLLGVAETSHETFKLPNGSLDVVGITVVGEQDGDAPIWRVQATDNDETPYILQLQGSKDPRSGVMDISEVMFFQMVGEQIPLTEDGWNKLHESFKATAFDLDGVNYDRIWGEEEEGPIDLFVLEEQGVELGGEVSYTSYQMLFGRMIDNFGEEETEFVLVGVEESEDSDVARTFVGFMLPAAAVKVQ